MQNDILFDNIYIGHSVEDAEKLKAETYDVKHPIETAEDEASKPKRSDDDVPKSPMDLKFMDDPVLYVREKVQLFMEIAKNDPIEAVRFVPEVAGGIGVLAVTLLAVILGGVLGGSKAKDSPQVKKAADKVKKAAADAKDQAIEATNQAVDAASSGAEKVQSEVNKRTTRASGPAE